MKYPVKKIGWFAVLAFGLRGGTLFAQTGQWTNLGLGGGGGLYAPAFSPADPNRLLVSSDMGGLYRSTNGGETWAMIDWKQINGACHHFPLFHPTEVNTVYAFGRKGNNRASLLRSLDGGLTWNAFAVSPPWGTDAVVSIYIDKGKPNLMFVGTAARAYVSVNSGVSWSVCPTVSGKVLGFLADQSSALANRDCFCATETGGVYHSADNGFTWTQRISGLPSANLRSFAGGNTCVGGGTVIYCVETSSNDIYKSTDNGANWVPAMGRLDTGYQFFKVICADSHSNTIYVNNKSNKNIYKSTDSGITWNEVFYSKLGTPGVELGWLEYAWSWGIHMGWGGALGTDSATGPGFAVCSSDPNYVIGTNSGEMFMSSDGGNAWRQVYSTYADTGAPAVHKRWKSRGLEVTTTWNYFIDPSDRNRHYICYTDICFARSLDGGKTWIHTDSGITSNNTVYDLAFDEGHPGTMYAAASSEHDIPGWSYIDDNYGSGEVVRSTDYGQTWARVSTGLPNAPATAIERDRNDGTLYVVIYGNGVYKSTNDGASWSPTPAFSVGNNRHVYGLLLHHDGTLFCLITARRVGAMNFPDPGGLFRSTDKGSTWTNIAAGAALYYPTAFDVHPNNSDMICMGSDNAPGHAQGGLYMTSNGGTTWSKPAMPYVDSYNTTAGFAPVFDPVNPATLYFCSYSGIFVSTDTGSTWADFPGLPFESTHRITFDPARTALYVSTFGGGIWERSVTAAPPAPDLPQGLTRAEPVNR